MHYSIFWDYTSATLPKEVPIFDLIREIEKKCYPNTLPERNAFFFYMNRPYPKKVDSEFEDKLRSAHFQIVKSQHTRDEADEISHEISQTLLKDLPPNEKIELVFICGDRKLNPKAHHFFQRFFFKVHLIHGKSAKVSDFKAYGADLVKLDDILSCFGVTGAGSGAGSGAAKDVPLPKAPPAQNSSQSTEDIKAMLCKLALNSTRESGKNLQLEFVNTTKLALKEASGSSTSASLSGKEPVKGKAKKGVSSASHVKLNTESSKNTKPGETKKFNAIKPNPTGKDQQNKKEKAQTAGNICHIEYDESKEKDLSNTLDAYLSACGGKVLKLSNGAGIVSLPSQAALDKTKNFLQTLTSAFGVSIQHKKKKSKQPEAALPSSQRDEKKPPSSRVNFADKGYFILLPGLKKTDKISTYREEIIKLLDDVRSKAIFFHPKSDWAVIVFNTKTDQLTGQMRLAKEKLSDGQELGPCLAEELPKNYVDSISQTLQK